MPNERKKKRSKQQRNIYSLQVSKVHSHKQSLIFHEPWRRIAIHNWIGDRKEIFSLAHEEEEEEEKIIMNVGGRQLIQIFVCSSRAIDSLLFQRSSKPTKLK